MYVEINHRKIIARLAFTLRYNKKGEVIRTLQHVGDILGKSRERVRQQIAYYLEYKEDHVRHKTQ